MRDVAEAAKKLQFRALLRRRRTRVLLAIRSGALKCAKATGPGKAEDFSAPSLSREDDERQLSKFRPVGDHFPARPGAGDLVPEPRSESSLERNHLQPAAD